MLCDDHDKVLIEPIGAKKEQLKKLYDFDLMEGGGHITGWLVEGKDVDEFNKALTEYTATVGEKYTGLKGTPMVFAVGDGNHSLATAKSCYEELKKNNPGVDLSNHPARYALVELENLLLINLDDTGDVRLGDVVDLVDEFATDVVSSKLTIDDDSGDAQAYLEELHRGKHCRRIFKAECGTTQNNGKAA